MCNFKRFLAWYLTRRNDNSLSSVLDVLMVYYYIHTSTKYSKTIQSMPLFQDAGDAEWKISQANQIQAIRTYMEFASAKSLKIHSALESYLEFRERQTTMDQIKKSELSQ